MGRLFFALTGCAVLLSAQTPRNIPELKQAFQHPPADARPMVRWWWFGPAVTKSELEREMRQMKEGGFGGFEVQPVYPLSLDDPAHGIRNLPYLSPEFLDALRFTGQKARELGLRMDLTLGSGWPFGGPHIPITEAAGRLRVDRVPVRDEANEVRMPKLGEGEKFIAAFAVLGDGRKFTEEEVQRLTDFEADAVKVPPVSLKHRTVLFFISSRTRQQVKRPAVGAEGLVLDHYDRAAIENHLRNVGDKLLQALDGDPPYAVFSDSLEVYNSDWTGDFLEQFQKRRGYDLTPYLPALAGEMGDISPAIRRDWGLTLTELANERYLTPLREWASQHSTRFRSQTYGIPPVALSSNALVDLPEGEGWHWRQFSATRWAASASHLYGRPVTSSETWTWLHSPVFRATPLDIKAEADLHFLVGINQLIGHGWPYSPPEAGEPGWRFYAAAVFNAHNPWWIVMPDVNAYLQRVSFLLRQGHPANDVALYLPEEDARAAFALGRDSINQAMDGLIGPNVIPQILDAGYDFDFVDDGALRAAALPYRVLILPGVRRIPLDAYRKIADFARHGGLVIATRNMPSMGPGLMESGKSTPDIQALSRALFESTGASGRFIADETKLSAALHAALPPDVATAPEIGFVHRKLEFAEVYFLANTSNHAVRSPAVFRVKDLQPSWWDPFKGSVAGAGSGSSVELDLAPYDSRVIVFSKEREPGISAPQTAAAAPMDLSGGWKVSFSEGGAPVTLDALRSWTAFDDRKYFSGQATYKKAVDLKQVPTGRLFLNFGEGAPVTTEERRAGNGMRAMLESPVREAALVIINGKRAGSVWKPPYEVEITGFLHPGSNELRIVVGNLAINELARGPLPDYKELNARYGERFQAQDMNHLQPLPSGLLGPVRLLNRR